MKRLIANIITLLLFLIPATAQELTLNECRRLALEQNLQSEINRENIAAARDMQKAAIAKFFPQVSVNGAYQWNEKNIHLLPNEAGLELGPNGWETLIPGTGNQVVDQRLAETLSQEYEKLYNASEINIEHLVVGYATITQPVFLGGKLIQSERLAKSGVQLMEIKAEKDKQDLITSVDEAYWRVLTVESKLQLASQYLDLLVHLESDVHDLLEAGLATEADLLKVQVKRQEAEMNRIKAANGLALSKMALCQLCGLDLNYDIHLRDEGLEESHLVSDTVSTDTERSEILLLQQAKNAAHAATMLTASSLMPNIVAKANYLVTNPNLHNGVQNKFSGMFTAGVVVNIPIAHADNIYEVRAAKHREEVVALQLEEVREKLQLQATQSRHAMELCNAKLLQADAAIRSAEANLRYAEDSFAAGLISTSDLMMAQTAWMQARAAKIEAAGEARLAEVTYLKHTAQLNY